MEIQVLDKKKHDRVNFDCGVEQLNTFLKEQANPAAKRYLSRTRVLIDTANPKEILGYHNLSYVETLPPQESRLYQQYPHLLPGLQLNRMAVDKQFQGRRLGEQLLLDVIFQVARMELEGLSIAPVVGLFVDPKNDTAKVFYEKYGFLEVHLNNEQSRLWLPVQICIDTYQIAHN